MALLGGCGDDAQTTDPPAAADFGHVHGLGINPADGAVFVATHTGLFRAGGGERSAKRVGDLFQDTMGFAVVGENAFLGSGHPDGRVGGPPLLGLIESRDAGRTWQPRVLAGEADFHVLRTAGGVLYAFDVAEERLMHGSVGGSGLSLKTKPPGSLIDLSPEEDRPERLVAATDRGLYESTDAAGSWHRLDRGRTGLLARSSTNRLVLVAADGTVESSSDGVRWRKSGAIGGQPAALTASGDLLVVAVHDGPVLSSDDEGRTWEVRIEP